MVGDCRKAKNSEKLRTEHAHINRRLLDAIRVASTAEVVPLVVSADVTNDVMVGALSQTHFDVYHLGHLLLLHASPSHAAKLTD